MNAKDYMAGVLLTESVPTSLQISETTLHAVLTLISATTAIADQVKRQLYYGNKGMDVAKLTEAVNGVGNMANYLSAMLDFGVSSMNVRDDAAQLEALQGESGLALNLANIDPRLLHSALGMFTETGEMLELITDAFEGKGMDKVGFVEEIGDADWYKQIGHHAIGVSEETCRRINNQKLTDKKAGRYKKGAFTVADAIERDTAVERNMMEGAQIGTVSVSTLQIGGVPASQIVGAEARVAA